MPELNDTSQNSSGHLQEINQEIYKHNLELAVANKTLSLLRKLYQITLLALDPASLSEKISETVRVDLNMEMVGMYLFDEKADTLKPFKFSKNQRLADISYKYHILFDEITITEVSNNPTIKKVIGDKKVALANPTDVWGNTINPADLKKIGDESHLVTTLLYPLVSQDKPIGMIVLCLNRDFNNLNQFEKDSIGSFVDVVSVALEKAMLYEQLRIANQELQRLDKARAEFISIASHQLRTPPATIKWYLAAVLNGDYGKLNAKVKDAVEKAQMVNNGQISLIDDMLNASRIERGKMEFLFEKADVQKLVENIIVALTPQAAMRKLKLAYKKPKTKIPQILADKEKLQQVVNNLVDNAIKYTKEGSVTVELDKTKTHVVIKVTDTGKGLTPEEEHSIFEKYGRGKDSQKHSSGLGLGLYVAKVITTHHNGTIQATSPGPGKGTSFIVSLPIKTDLKEEVYDMTSAQNQL